MVHTGQVNGYSHTTDVLEVSTRRSVQKQRQEQRCRDLHKKRGRLTQRKAEEQPALIYTCLSKVLGSSPARCWWCSGGTSGRPDAEPPPPSLPVCKDKFIWPFLIFIHLFIDFWQVIFFFACMVKTGDSHLHSHHFCAISDNFKCFFFIVCSCDFTWSDILLDNFEIICAEKDHFMCTNFPMYVISWS